MGAATAINTFSGRLLDFADPKPISICLEDIAHGLSMVPRFGAQALAFRSVAQHAVFVSEILERLGRTDLAAAGLHHDSHEAFACDIPSPLKRLLEPQYSELTNRLDEAICSALILRLPEKGSEDAAALKRADKAALELEAGTLLAGARPPHQLDPATLEAAKATYEAIHWEAELARDAFLRRAAQLA